VDISVVRSLVPESYGLLPIDEELLPNFPTGKFPLVIRGGVDFNITSTRGLFVFAYAGIYIPFVDRLNDGHTAFLYNPYAFQDNPIALIGTTLFTGVIVSPAFIDPSPGSDSNDAYYSDQENGNLGFRASALIGGGKVVFDFVKIDSAPWSKETYLGISDLPTFGPFSPFCYKHIEYDPENYSFVKGTVTLGAPPLKASEIVFTSVTGFTASKLFIEDLFMSCTSFAS